MLVKNKFYKLPLENVFSFVQGDDVEIVNFLMLTS